MKSGPQGGRKGSARGAHWGWVHHAWSGAWEAVHITVKELLPVVAACAVWGRAAKGDRSQC